MKKMVDIYIQVCYIKNITNGDDIMWTNDLMDAYAAELTRVEQLVLSAISYGYSDLEDVKDYVYLAEPAADLSYAECYFSAITNVDRMVRLEV